MRYRAANWCGGVLVFLLVGAAACNSGDNLSEPGGTLEIITAATGAELDPDGYTVQVDGQQWSAIGTSATIQQNITAGDHAVQLAGLATRPIPWVAPVTRAV